LLSGVVADWAPLGPFGGDAVTVAVALDDPQTVLAGIASRGVSAGGSMYRSADGGSTWTEVAEFQNGGDSVYDVEFAAAGTAYAASFNSVWKSSDSGASWSQLDLGLGVNDKVLEIAVDPHDPDKVWAGIPGQEISIGEGETEMVSLYRSTDGGASWTEVTPPLTSPLTAQAVAFHPTDPDMVYVAFGGGFGGGEFWVSSDYGTSWVDRSGGLPANPLRDVVHDGSRLLVAGGQVFGGQSVGLYESADDGASWFALHDASWPVLAIADIELDPGDSSVVLLASESAGLFRSLDGGATWSFGVGGTESMTLRFVHVAPTDSSRVYSGGDFVAVIQSTDGGDSFQGSSTGILELNAVSVTVNPIDTNELAIAVSSSNTGGVWTSADGGQTWLQASVPATRWNTAQFAPQGTLYAISDGPTTVAPEGVYRRNPDQSWTSLGPDQGTLFETELQTLQFSSTDPNLILAGGSDSGPEQYEAVIWKSTDAGDTWAKAYEGTVRSEDVRDIEIVEDGTDDTLLAAYSHFGQLPQEGGLLRSVDGGATWVESMTGLPAGVQGFELAVSPADPNTFFLADGDTGTGNGGVFKSTDAGQTWSSTGYVGPIRSLRTDPADDQVLYAVPGSASPKLLRSVDQGATFEPFDDGLEAISTGLDLAMAGGVSRRLLLASRGGVYATVLGPPQVVDRHIFYNNSYSDGDNPAANANDDNAIAPDPANASDPTLGKTVLFPDQTATFQNYTSYWRGINGMMVDIANLPDAGGLSTADFEFRVSNRNNSPSDNTDDPSTWALSPTPTVTVREDAGTGGSDRVTLIWDDHAIENQWLQVTVKATSATGLDQDDTFYFGNAIGECGDATAFTFVDGTDFAGARDNTHDPDDRAPIDDRFDYDRDSLVDGADLAIARDNHTNFLTCLTLFTVPPLGGSASSSPSSPSFAPTVQLSEVSSLVDHELRAGVTISGSDWPRHYLVDRPYLRPTTRQPADLPQQRTEDFDSQTASAILQDLRTDDIALASDSRLQTTGDRWLNAVDDYFENDECNLFTW